MAFFIAKDGVGVGWNKEWNDRVKIWIEELKSHFYTELGTVEMKGFSTMELLSLQQAAACEFSPMPVRTKWGKKWEYGWFCAQVVLPEQAKGKRIVLKPNVGGEMLVWVNGCHAGSKDLQHSEITLTCSANGDETYQIMLESYAGHGPRLENGGPCPPERISVPEPPVYQVEVGNSTYGIWHEDAYQLWMDAVTLYELLCAIDPKSLRAQQIAKGLCDFTTIADFEQPWEQREESFRAARKRLAPLLQCENGSTAPLFTVFGQSHLDLAWKWPFEETKRKCARTLSTQLALMEEYPEYRFLLCEPPIFETVKAYYPELYADLKEKIANGQLMPEGGVWVECDTNIPSGESLIRQLVWGKRWFADECGTDTKMVWMPDVFGFSPVLPQLMLGCGMNYFATQKILRNYHDADPFAFNIFMWEGMDGSQILTHIYKKNNSQYNPRLLIERWEQDRNQQDDISTFLFPFGFGDGGGGPTRDMLESVRRTKNLEGAPKTRIANPVDFFTDVEREGLPKNRYVGELYFAAHRGSYTSQAKTKKGCRKAEIALHEAEFWSSAAMVCQKADYPDDKLNVQWKSLLFNQFHDILPGTSITRVQAEAEADFAKIQQEALYITEDAISQFLHNNTGMAVLNSLSWKRTELIALPAGKNSARGSNGAFLPSQKIDGTVFVKVSLPSCGWTTIYPSSEKLPNTGENCFAVTAAREPFGLENEYLRIQLNELGQITEIYDKESDTQLAKGLCNDFQMYQDITTCYDAWDINSMYHEVPVTLDAPAKIEVFCEGSLAAGIRVSRKLHDSDMVQEITLRQGSRRVDFKTSIDWKESHKLLKVAFPVNIFTDESVEEIQFGYVKRPNHQSRRYDADRFEVSCHRYAALTEAGRGFALLNDCKYGISADKNVLSLTLLKSPLVPDMYADKGMQEFTYSFYAYNGAFAQSGVVQNGYELNVPPVTVTGDMGAGSLFSLSHSNVILETVKAADDGSGELILRLYESQKMSVRCTLTTAFSSFSAQQTNMLEENRKEIDVKDGKMTLDFRPFEVKTVRLHIASPDLHVK